MGKTKVCQAIDVWTFRELVGAFLNLAIAYCLLCGSTLAYLASQFLGFFGMSLPCPCNGHFGNPNKNNCENSWQGFLVDCPIRKIYNIQYLAKTKFPLDSILANELNSQFSGRECDEGHAAWEGETSCASSSQGLIGRENPMRERKFDYKGKVVKSQRPTSGISRLRKGAFGDKKSHSFSSFDHLLSYGQSVSESPGSLNKMEFKSNEGSSVPVHLEREVRDGSRGASKEVIIMASEKNEHVDEAITSKKDTSSVEKLNYDPQGELGSGDIDINTIRILEQALEEEHAARTDLYLELEKERSAAATAAEEAMAMILRLQEEKASIEMEARQYQRVIEEKYEYDAEEMNILKEILIRREREKHFLEKEVETLRQMFFDADTETTEGPTATSSLYSSEDPLSMLQQINESVVEKRKVKSEKDFPGYEVTSIESQNYTLTSGKGLPYVELDEEVDSSKSGYVSKHPSLQEKGIGPGSVDNDPGDQPREVQRLAQCLAFDRSASQMHVHGKTIIPEGEKEKFDELQKSTDACDYSNTIVKYSNAEVGKHKNGPESSVIGEDHCIHDVHAIAHELDEGSGNNQGDISDILTLYSPIRCDSPIIDSSGTGVVMRRSSSDLFRRQMSFSEGKNLLVDLRRNSMSSFDYERLKIDNEVGFLRERLKIVQEGREKLNFSTGHSGREKIQLQLLEDIANQLREIRQLTQPGKAARQASVPPLSSKVVSKKRFL